MSGVAAIMGAECNMGLVPRYVREGTAEDDPGVPGGAWQSPSAMTLQDVGALTEELRRRITVSAKPERRGAKPLLFGMAALVAITATLVLFPDVVLALLPNFAPAL